MILNSFFQYFIQRDCIIASSMVQDGMRNMGSKGTVLDEVWMRELKGAAATAFLGGYHTR